MQFRLPEQLQTELLAYDPKLKALARSQNPKKQTKKATHPLGNPNDLIPDDVVRASLLQDAIDNINGNPAAGRFQIFTKVVDVATPEARTVTVAILYYYEQCWYAAWLPPKGKENEYLYGYAYAYKDTATALKMVSRSLNEERHENLTVEKQYGRSKFFVRQAVITIEDVRKSKYDQSVRRWNIPGVTSYYRKSQDMYRAITGFEDALRNKIPTWSDSRGIFDRVRCTGIGNLLIEEATPNVVADLESWLPSYESLMQIIDSDPGEYPYRLVEYRSFASIKHIINTPYFRRWIQQQCDLSIATFNNPATEYAADVKRPWLTIKAYLGAINSIYAIWPNCPIDYYQNNIDVLLGVTFRLNQNEKTFEWLRQHMPIASFIGILSKFYQEQLQEAKKDNRLHHRRSLYYSERLGRNVFSFSDLSDALSMLTQVLSHGDLEPPKRWRIAEFHDYVQGEAWKIKNPNEGLPQDLFPQPVKVQLDGETWLFFQPYDTHQLSSWGQAVRNCIGSATHYAEDCKKKKHFIVLCMIDGKPQFTIQLTVDMGMMSVKQIAGIANKSLTQEQKDQYTQAFGLALQSRNAQLVSA